MGFPQQRPRRTRQSDAWRRLVRETRLTPEALVYPLFVVPGRAVRHAVESMPGIFQLSVDEAVKDAKAVAAAGVPAVLLFAAPAHKDGKATSATDPKGLAAQAIAAIKEACPELILWADVCLCGATDHGHCGHVLAGGAIDNDSSIKTLFREAAESTPAFGDRRSYQMDPANAREALREVLLDVEEGADLVMVKPAGPYLDVIRQVRDAVSVPVVAYQVSGEFSLIKAAAARGWIDERAAALETLTGIRRAGADLIISYFAPEVARWLRA